MKETTNTIQAWRDPAYRASLSEAELAQLPENPAGIIELTGTALDVVAGGWGKGKGRKSSKSHKSSKSRRSSKSGKSSKSHKSSRSNRSGSCGR